MSEKHKQSGPTQTETLLGGTELAVQLSGIDGQELVRVRQLTIKEFPGLLAVIDDELKIAEKYCDKPAGWAETLTLDSLESVIEEGERLNADFFSRWAQRRMNRQEKLMPGVTEKVLKAATSPLQSGSRMSASSAA